MKRIILLILLALALFISLRGIYYLQQKLKNNQEANNQAIAEDTVKKIKVDMLSSEDPRTAALGIAVNYYPAEELKLKRDGGNGVYPFKFYGIELNELQYTKLVDYFLSTNKAPSYSFHIENMLHREYGSSEDSLWNRFWHDSGEYLVAKEGFVCLYPFEEKKIGGIWYPQDYNSQFIAPPPLVFRCSYIASPDDNTLAKIAPFIRKFLSENNIACLSDCIVTDKFEHEYLSEESFSMPNHTAQLGYSEKYGIFSEEFVNNLRLEVQNVGEMLESADWEIDIKETTNSKLIRNWLTLNLTADNQRFECRVDTEVWGHLYQNYIPSHKLLRKQHPQYSDKEFEKFMMGGQIKRSITCFKTLKEE